MKGILWYLSALLALSFGVSFGAESLDKPILYETNPHVLSVSSPNEQRDEKYARFLGISLKIHVDGASGSGTICHFDKSSGFAHVISCGHLWSGNMSYDKHNPPNHSAKVITWYKKGAKLERPESFNAEVLFWSNDRGYDVSLLRFKPDWEPEFAPIDESFNIEKGMILNSLGCDGGSEVARYEVSFKEFSGMDIITVKNSPRPGRSGGGLITDCGKFVGVCWGTSDTSSGNGIGYFTPVNSIKEVFVKNEHGWLLGLLGFRSIPIKDIENPEARYGEDFVPFPSRLKIF